MRETNSNMVAGVTKQAKELCTPRLGALTKLSGQERLPKGGATCANCWKMVRNWPGRKNLGKAVTLMEGRRHVGR